jgi:hypothetical protein
MKFRLAQALTLGVLMMMLGSASHAAEWQVSRVTGQGWIVQKNVKQVALKAGTVPRGSTITTAARARAMLVHGQDSVMLGPSTTVVVPVRPDQGLTTTVVQQVGTTTVSVQKRESPHFPVQTPFWQPS